MLCEEYPAWMLTSLSEGSLAPLLRKEEEYLLRFSSTKKNQ